MPYFFLYFRNMNTLSLALKDSLQVAQDQGRITCGIYATATMLEACPDHVMFCVLPVTSCGIVEKDIQCTLIEAFCSENEVRLIKVGLNINIFLRIRLEIAETWHLGHPIGLQSPVRLGSLEESTLLKRVQSDWQGRLYVTLGCPRCEMVAETT
jgi:hypothetical protein